MTSADDFDKVRSDPDPIRRGRRATDLMTTYQQRSFELARLRKEAVEDAHGAGLSYTEVADLIGITKSRISQIRTTAPKPERAFFGVGPVAIGIPRRFGDEDGRPRPYFDANDQGAQEALERTLTDLTLATSRYGIDPEDETPPDGDCVVVCGPKSAPVARYLLEADHTLSFHRTDEGWYIKDEHTDRRHFSPFRINSAAHADIGYFSRRIDGGRVIVHIAGITAIGSAGVAHWLNDNLPTVYDPAARFTNGVIQCDFDDGLTVTGSHLVAGPYTHD